MLSDQSRHSSFPSLDQMSYLNTAAEGIPPLQVRAALDRYFEDKQLGMDGREAHDAEWHAVKALTAEMYGLTADEIGICSCSSEAYNLASLALQLQPDDEVIINDLDFPAAATPWLQATSVASARIWRARDGALLVEDLLDLLSPKTRLVTASLVSFFNGYMLALPEVVEVVHQHSSALVAVDVTQALGRIPLDLTGADLIVSSTYKWILASHGGGLVGVPAHRTADWTVPAGGWFHLENPFGPERFERAVSRPGAASFSVGTPNYPAVYAIRAGLEYIQNVGVDSIAEATAPLVQACIEGLASLPVELLTPMDKAHLAGIVAFRHPAMKAINRHLHARGIHVMSHAGRMRISIHGYNRMSDIEALLEGLHEALKHVPAR